MVEFRTCNEFYDVDNLVLITQYSLIKSLTLEHTQLRNIYTIRRGERNISIKKWEIDYYKIKIIPFIKDLRRNSAICYGQVQVQELGFTILFN